LCLRSHESVEFVVTRVRNLLLANSFHPVANQISSVVSWEWTTVRHECGRKDAISNKVLVFEIKFINCGLPTKFLASKTLNEPLTTINLGLEILEYSFILFKLRLFSIIKNFELL
jgi:hypothetical protein